MTISSTLIEKSVKTAFWRRLSGVLAKAKAARKKMITNRDSVCNYEFLYLFSANYENFCYLHRKNPLKWHFGGVRRWQRRLKIKHDLNRDNAYGSKKYGYQFSAKYDNFKYTLGKIR